MNGTPQPHLIFGEVLVDCFPDGTRVLGGAPFNVAWNLHQLGEAACFVGGVGDDADGRSIRERMNRIGMDTRGLYRHPAAPTGQVRIALEDGEPTYTIVPDQAYDTVPAEWADQLPDTAGLLYHGTLAMRADNRELLERLQARAQHRFVDVNLRAPWYQPDDVLALMRGADVVKLNTDEAATLAPDVAAPERSAALLERAAIRSALIITHGADGAAIHTTDGQHWQAPAPAVDGFRDAVGAGDAFASVAIIGQQHGWPWATTLDRALQFAAAVCSLQGATTADATFYREASRDWRSA
ncbi:PfkB family carbohydrate kinase [Thioalkalivibrio sp. AKL12]|uniref:PfkB family carbohydrate kinase n=1 Tax=Thioalkalivibrio sp. AKL12 TaxID=1158159 RepID=UPI000366F0F6|nr:PfkB family carbohydrate kinase [Thioalkalivibrio sp. AKL12]